MNRRQFFKQSLVAAGVFGQLSLTSSRGASIEDAPLGFMLHSLRTHVIDDFAGTLATMVSLGYEELELVSFTGFSGPHPRDGFDLLASLLPTTIGRIVRNAGLATKSAHFKYAELDDSNIDRALEWAHALGLRYVTLADLDPASSLDDWHRQFDRLNAVGARLTEAGLRLGLHTPNEIWHHVEKRLVMDEFLLAVEPENCQLQLELSTAQNNGIDSARFMRRASGRVFSVHLRDAITPPEPVPYLASLPLGQGDLNWSEIFAAAESPDIDMYIVEMQTRGAENPIDPIEAYRISAEFIREFRTSRRLLGR